MTSPSSTTGMVWVAIDVAKVAHQVLVETPDGRRRGLRVMNSAADIERFIAYLEALSGSCTVAFEPTGHYHRALMYRLGRRALPCGRSRRSS